MNNNTTHQLLIVWLLSVTFIGQAAIAQTTRPTLFIIGDSTVKNGTTGQVGWGDPIREMFDLSRIDVVNRARGGRSSRTFQTEGLWENVLKEAKPGDFVIMQFGHNDGGALSGDNRERGSIRGTGDQSQEVTLTLGANQGKKETVHTFGWYMRKYIDDAAAKGMTSIVCSPIPHCPTAEPVDPPTTQFTSYRAWAQESAASRNIGFIDLYGIALSHYHGISPQQIKQSYFTPADNTHTSLAGAELNAQSVVEGIRMLKDCPLRQYLR
jgi:rhamnogalacturonan acetylesterase